MLALLTQLAQVRITAFPNFYENRKEFDAAEVIDRSVLLGVRVDSAKKFNIID